MDERDTRDLVNYRLRDGKGGYQNMQWGVYRGSGMEDYLRKTYGDLLEEYTPERSASLAAGNPAVDWVKQAQYRNQQRVLEETGPFAQFYRRQREAAIQNRRNQSNGSLMGGGMIMADNGGGPRTTAVGTRRSFAQEEYTIDPVTGRRRFV